MSNEAGDSQIIVKLFIELSSDSTTNPICLSESFCLQELFNK
ncbi:hypothetical protein CAXC1_300034 [Candidatus Xenohaliotis californiensis]|uniref:Uncharacterized protein n=1 Tax=Candidatus Xenohaliotis californiensis TaxID=84677 RepID=A0ABM9N896_9RICK|nr:hypothetical protein CAXC1_300034 [Candidatus Xenohaliotis californiensis]